MVLLLRYFLGCLIGMARARQDIVLENWHEDVAVAGEVRGTDAQYPAAGLVQARDGNLYGTTFGGGAYGFGAVYRLGLVRTCATCCP